MKTDELIHRLTTDLPPVHRFVPRTRAAWWLAAAAAYVGITAGAALTRVGAGAASGTGYLLEQMATAALAITGAFAAFASAVPGEGRWALRLTIAAAAAWLTIVVAGTLGDLQAGATFRATLASEWTCIVSMLSAGGVLWVLMAFALPRRAVVGPDAPALAAGLAAVGVANLQACLVHPHAFSGTVLVWHGGTMALMGLVFTAAGVRILGARAYRP